jgi:hypothetical protein
VHGTGPRLRQLMTVYLDPSDPREDVIERMVVGL